MQIIFLLIAALALSSCKQTPNLPSIISPYRIDIQQGNVVTQEMVDKLKAGQTRSQVRFVLGSPLIADMFHNDRWDYVYLMQKQGKPDERRRLTVIFDGDKLLRLEGDVVATDKLLAPAAIAPAKPAAVAPHAPKPAADEPALKPPVSSTPSPRSETTTDEARPAAARPADKPMPGGGTDAAQTDAVKAAAPKAGPDSVGAAKAAASNKDVPKSDAASSDEIKEAPKRGMFGRMLDKIGL